MALIASLCLFAATANAGTTAENAKILQELEIMLSPAFVANLQTCSPHEHVYSNPFSGSVGKIVIVGQRDGKCSYATIEDGNIIKCRIPMEFMPQISNEFADVLSKARMGNFDLSIDNSTFQKIMNDPNICKEEVAKQ